MSEARQERIDRQPGAFGRLRRHVLYGKVSANAKVVFAVIDDHQGKTSAGRERPAFPSYAQIARLLRCSERTVSRAVAQLVALGALRVEHRPGRTNLMMALPTPDTGDPGISPNGDIRDAGDLPGETGGSDSRGRQRRIRKKNHEEDHAGGEAEGDSQRPTPGVAGTPGPDEEPSGATLAELRTHSNETIRQIVERLSQSLGDIDADER